jgi:hypothetical protein
MSAFPHRMPVESSAPPDIDRILDAIRGEARQRGAKGGIGSYALGAAEDAPSVRHPGLLSLEPRHAADFLAMPLDVFLANAYRRALGRDADAAGAAHYQRALLRGSLTRIEVLGRLFYSPEGRSHGAAIPGLGIAFALATAYRIPVLGPVAALAAWLLRLPAHWQDRSRVEAAALASGSWMKR